MHKKAAADPGGAVSRFNWGSYKFTMPHFFQLPIPLKLYSGFMGRVILPVLLVTSQRKNGLGLFLAHVIF